MPSVSSTTIHSSQHAATIMSSATTTVTTSIYHQQQQQQQQQQQVQQSSQVPSPVTSSTPSQHQQRSSSSATGTTTSNSLSSSGGTITTHGTHTLTTANAIPSIMNSVNHMTTLTRKSPPLPHGVHSSRGKDAGTVAISTTTNASSTSTSSTMITTVTTANTSATTQQPAFVRPFEDSFRSSSKPQPRPVVNSHNHIITNQISYQESPVKLAVAVTTTSHTIAGQIITENSIADNTKSMNIQQSLSHPIPYPPQQFHHPHIPVSHVASLYKPPPHFSSSSPHQHHSQAKVSVPALATGSNGSASNSSGAIATTNSNCTKQQSGTLHVNESNSTATVTQRNEISCSLSSSSPPSSSSPS